MDFRVLAPLPRFLPLAQRVWPRIRHGRLQLIRLVPRAGLGWAGMLVAGSAVFAATPAATALATGEVVDDAAAVAGHHAEPVTLVVPLAYLVVVLVLAQLSQSVLEVAQIAAARRIDGWVRSRVRGIAMAPPGIERLESEEFQSELLRASDLGAYRGRHRSPGTAAVGQVALLFRLLSAAGAAVVLAMFSVWLAGGLLVAAVAIRAIVRRQFMVLVAMDDSGVPHERRAEYWSEVANGAEAGKEVRLFGLADWVVSKRRQAALTWLTPLWQERRRVLRRQLPTVSLTVASALAALLVPGVAAATGRIGAGELAVCLVAAWGVFNISFMGQEALDIEYGMGALQAFARLQSRGESAARRDAPAVSEARGSAPDIRFENVTFCYPNASHPALDGLTLQIAPGEVIAVVGRNGAGKTTLVKLLAGLYRPTSGQIVVDGKQLTEPMVERWRPRITAVFQSFVHYPLSVHDNIALSAPGHLTDVSGVVEAARVAGAESMIKRLPAGMDSVLWRGAAGGVELSGGQWQRIAIARALFAVAHGCRLLVLDEPTAHLDVQAEAEFYEDIVRHVRDVSVVLISHRLSTVRHADRIVLLGGGRVVESGGHEELMAAEGEYARLFRLQAAPFADERTQR